VGQNANPIHVSAPSRPRKRLRRHSYLRLPKLIVASCPLRHRCCRLNHGGPSQPRGSDFRRRSDRAAPSPSQSSIKPARNAASLEGRTVTSSRPGVPRIRLGVLRAEWCTAPPEQNNIPYRDHYLASALSGCLSSGHTICGMAMRPISLLPVSITGQWPTASGTVRLVSTSRPNVHGISESQRHPAKVSSTFLVSRRDVAR
jgi:hypothetical protein